MILFLFIVLVISLIFSCLYIFDESPLAEVFDLGMKTIVVVFVGITLVDKYFG